LLFPRIGGRYPFAIRRQLGMSCQTERRLRGRVHVFLGIAPGAGKTFSMLAEGPSRSSALVSNLRQR
jgi:K+-sensing histidine kinase KdpD